MASLQDPMHCKATRARGARRDLRGDLDVLGAAATLLSVWSLAAVVLHRRFPQFPEFC